MLRNAVQKHEKDAAPKSFFPNSSPADAPTRQSSQSALNPAFRNPLQPASTSSTNALRKSQEPRPMGGVKRTSSGLAKALDGAFEDGAGSQQNPLRVDGGKSSGVLQVTQNDFIDENDFDSDVDLDFEEPQAKKLAPTASAKRAAGPPPQSIAYPSVPRQQQKQTSYDADATYGSVDAHTSEIPGSSAPLPWSSSPAGHHAPALSGTSIADAMYRSNAPAQRSQIQQPSQPPKPTSRRKLPWPVESAEESNQEDLTQHSKPNRPASKSLGGFVAPSAKVKKEPTATPVAKDKQKFSQPWNTTASAVKEQQKKHREETRKFRQNDADSEAVTATKTSAQRPAKVFLSEEQQHVLDLVMDKKRSVFFTGSAGTGKSVLMREIIASLRKRYQREPDRVAVTASTGLAACNVGGVTLHSFAGIGLGKEEVPELVRKIKRNQKAKHRWIRTKVLVVDEVSMVDGDLFDKLEAIARLLRNNGRPFGGIQLIITGDFFQLPPVPDQGRVAKFAFDAATWNTTIEHTIGLHHVFRQKDPVFAGMLNEMREGRLQPASIEAFKKLSRPLDTTDTLEGTELFPTRMEVESANSSRLRMLQGETQIFDARDGGTIVDKAQRDKLLANCMAPESMTLKKGAQVMLIKNIDESLVNGSLGRVIGFMDEKKFDSYTNAKDTFDSSPGGGIIGDTGPEDAIKRRTLESITTARIWPVVRFVITDGTSRDLLCQPEMWKVELPNGEVQASRSQVPLILAWALSIHKAQGQTLERVKVDLGKVFEKGQAYVALSRATSMAGLQVLRFDPRKVNAHDKVRTFYSNLSRVELAQKNAERAGGTEKDKKDPRMPSEYERRFMEDGL